MADETVKRGPGRPPKPLASSVMYRPIENGDPIHTEAWGYKFRVGEPVEISDPEVLAMARGNPWFVVDGVAAKRVAPTGEPVPPPGNPELLDVIDENKMVDAEDE